MFTHLFDRPSDNLKSNKHHRLLSVGILVVLLIAFTLIIIQRAWLSDDAYITFRTVDNFIHGYRLTWNTIERVQAYTHPLWMFLLSGVYAITHNMYMTGIGLGLGISLLAVILFAVKISQSNAGTILGICLLSLSCAYVDYSTSGLENPLSHLLFVLFMVVYYQRFRGDLFFLTLIASLVGMTRLDLMLIYIPLLAFRFFENFSMSRWKELFTSLLLGFLPLLIWEMFSLFYYGFLFPNTAYAKLNTGIPANELWFQGFHYFLNMLERDPVGSFAILSGMVISIVLPEFRAGDIRKQWWRNLNIPLTIGMSLYLVYILKIGGDFMSGRFFTPLILSGVVIISRIHFSDFRDMRQKIFVFSSYGLVVLVIGLAITPTPAFLLQTNRQKATVDEYGIADERVWYFDDLGFLNVWAVGGEPVMEARQTASALRQEAEGDLLIQVMGNTGVFGFYAGPNVYIIDMYALSEPLLARLPSVYTPEWRVGHYQRVVPDGYIAKIYGLGELADPGLVEFYSKLSVITQGSLFDLSRLKEIWLMNTGAYQALIDWDRYRYQSSSNLLP